MKVLSNKTYRELKGEIENNRQEVRKLKELLALIPINQILDGGLFLPSNETKNLIILKIKELEGE